MFTYLYYFLSCANMYWSSETRYLLGSAVLSHWSSFTTTSTKILIISQFWFWIVMESLCFSLFFYFSCFFLKVIIHGCRHSIILTFHISRSILLDFFFFFLVFWVLTTLVFLILVFVISAKTVKSYLFLTILHWSMVV